jgi:hypothetical protein
MTRSALRSDELVHLRTAYGESTRFWTGGQQVVEEGRWIAFTGATDVSLNTALCHGPAGGALLPATLEAVTATRVPASITVAGEALGAVQTLVRKNWVCVGAPPLMTLQLDELDAETDVDVAMVDASELPAARMLVEDAFSLEPGLSAAHLPDTAISGDGLAVWALRDRGEMVCCMGTARTDDAIVIWSMATPARARRRGHARRLLRGALTQIRTSGASVCLLSSSGIGEPFYASLGFTVVERWQMWSRPRWLLADD